MSLETGLTDKTDSNRSFDKIVFLVLSEGLNIALLGRITPGDLQFISKINT